MIKTNRRGFLTHTIPAGLGVTAGACALSGQPERIRPPNIVWIMQDDTEKNDITSRKPEIIVGIEKYLRSARTEPRAQLDPARPPGPPYSLGL